MMETVLSHLNLLFCNIVVKTNTNSHIHIHENKETNAADFGSLKNDSIILRIIRAKILVRLQI